MKTVAIVTPAFYKSGFSEDEKLSLEKSDKYLNKYDRYFIVPKRIDIKKNKHKGYKFIKFPDWYFSNTETYNKLLLSENFYTKFKNYKFILIYQLDALVFSDELIKWCDSGYDYVSAPWFFPVIGTLSHMKGQPFSGGNGGLSLRNVQSCLKVLKAINQKAQRSSKNRWIQKFWFLIAVITGKSHKIWLNSPSENYPFNEDGIWSLEAPKYLKSYRVAPLKTALEFSFETLPKLCFAINNKKLPFGCHAWGKYDREFWTPYL